MKIKCLIFKCDCIRTLWCRCLVILFKLVEAYHTHKQTHTHTHTCTQPLAIWQKPLAVSAQ